jgi:hypothetical protein
MLASLNGYLQCRLCSCALRDGLRRNLERLSVSDPPFDLVKATFPAQLVEGSDVFWGLGKKAMLGGILVFGHRDGL